MKLFNTLIGKEITAQIVPIPESVQRIPGRFSKATNELVFEAANIAPLGYQSFYVQQNTNEHDNIQNDESTSNNVQAINKNV